MSVATPSAKLRELADFIETKEAEFDYSVWTHFCGTPACAGGWACALWPDVLELRPEPVILKYSVSILVPTLVSDEAVGSSAALAAAIGISKSDADGIFQPEEYSHLLQDRGPSDDATAPEVATWLRRHADALEAQ